MPPDPVRPPDRAPVSPSNQNPESSIDQKNSGCTGKEANDGQNVSNGGGICPMTTDDGNSCEEADKPRHEPNSPDLGAPIYCAGNSMTPFEQMVEDLRL